MQPAARAMQEDVNQSLKQFILNALLQPFLCSIRCIDVFAAWVALAKTASRTYVMQRERQHLTTKLVFVRHLERLYPSLPSQLLESGREWSRRLPGGRSQQDRGFPI